MDDSTVFKRSPKARETKEKSLSMRFRDDRSGIPKAPHWTEEAVNVITRRQLVSGVSPYDFSQGDTIKDLNSTNGTFVNGKPLQKMEKRLLAAGDTVLVGKTELKISAVPGQ